MAETDRIHLVADLSLVHTLGQWRYPGAWAGYPPYGDPALYLDLARLLEQGKFDGAFFADVAGTPIVGGSIDPTVEWGVAWPRHDPLPLAIAMASVTERLGFITTMSTTYHHPFHVARLFASADHVTRGRIAYNAVVSGFPQEAQNYGFETTPDHDWRYDRADEFLEVMDKLWNSVEPDAMIWDRVTGRVSDPAKVHRIDHRGRHFRVMGPLPTAPGPQGRPVQFQAGASDAGIALAARWADMQFAATASIDNMKKHRERLDTAIRAAGRAPHDVGIMWSGRVDVVSGPAEKAHNDQQLRDSISDEMAVTFVSQWWGLDGFRLDPRRAVHETIEEVKALELGPNWSYLDEALSITDERTTILQFARQWLESDRGWNGTPQEIADRMEEAHYAGGANGGFMIAPRSGVPGGLSRFVREVVPILQERGLMRRDYSGPTLRENLLD